MLDRRHASITRRAVVAGLLTTPLTACGENPLAVNVVRAIRFSTIGLPDVPISRDAVSKLPYASIAAKIGKGPRSLLILWRRERDDLHWISADAAVVVTRRGRVVKTAGLPENIRETIPVGPDPFSEGLHNLQAGTTFFRSVDLDPGMTGMRIDSNYEVRGARSVRITEIDFETILIVERNVARTVNWSFENLFWIDPFDGFIWKSRQHIARAFPPVEIEVLKPAA